MAGYSGRSEEEEPLPSSSAPSSPARFPVRGGRHSSADMGGELTDVSDFASYGANSHRGGSRGEQPAGPPPARPLWDPPLANPYATSRGRRAANPDPVAAYAGAVAVAAGVLGILASLLLRNTVGLTLSIVLGIAAVACGAYSAANRRHTGSSMLAVALAGIVLGLLAMLLSIGMAYSRSAHGHDGDDPLQGAQNTRQAPGDAPPVAPPVAPPSQPSAEASSPPPPPATRLFIGFGEKASSTKGDVEFEFSKPVRASRAPGALLPDHIPMTFDVVIRNSGTAPYTPALHLTGEVEGTGAPLQAFIREQPPTSNFIFGPVAPGATVRTTAGFLVPPGTRAVRIHADPGDRFPPFEVRGKVPS